MQGSVPLLKKSASRFIPDGPLWWRVFQWFVPAFTNGCSIFVCMWFLHVGTYFYIMQMTHFEEAYVLKTGSTNFSMPIMGPYGSLSPGTTMQNVSFGSLEDPVEGWLGYSAVNIHVLDGVAAAFPFVWMVGTVWTKDLHLWTKILTANALLAFGKGCLGMMTTVPDSSGWANCKHRLGEKNIAFLKEEVHNPYTDGFAATFFDIALMELRGPRMRYCADMMYSGHTYFTCLYALGLLELTRRQVIKRGYEGWKKKAPVYAVIAVCLLQQSIEIFLVLESRFHYSMDIAVAVVATLLIYTNGPVVLHAQWWSTHTDLFHAEHLKDEDGHYHAKFSVDKQKIRVEGDLYVPPCCLPFACLFQGYHHLISTAEVMSHDDEIDSSTMA